MRRGSIEIIRDILALGRFNTNDAIYRVGLNPPQFGRYRGVLLRAGLLRAVPPENGRRSKAYEATGRGVELRRRIDRVLELLPHIRSAITPGDGGRKPRGTAPLGDEAVATAKEAIAAGGPRE